MKYVTVIGSLNLDLVIQASRAPNAGETLAGTDFRMIPGGKGANQAVAASRSGASTRMIGCVGEDAFGKILLKSLSDSRVNVEGIHTISKVSTGIANILIDEKGENRIIIIPGSNAHMTEEILDAEWEKIRNSFMVILQHEIPLQTVHSAISRCHKEGIPVILNPAPIYPIPEKLLLLVDILVLNESESSALLGTSLGGVEEAKLAARKLTRSKSQTVIITMGKVGAVLANGNREIHQPAFLVKPIDTTAAGDTFVGSYAAALVDGKSIEDSLIYAAAASAVTCTRLGAQASIPSKNEVLEFMMSYSRPFAKKGEYSI